MVERVAGLAVGAVLVILAALPAQAEPQALHTLTAAQAIADEAAASGMSRFARETLRRHLAKTGLEAALYGTRLRVAELPARRIAARHRHERAAERLRRTRLALARRLGSVLVARRSDSSPRTVAIRRGALRLAGRAWRGAETASRDAAPADIWFVRERLDAVRLAGHLSDRIDALEGARDLSPVWDLLADGTAAANGSPALLLATSDATRPLRGIAVGIDWRGHPGAHRDDRTASIGWPEVLASVLVNRKTPGTLESIDRGLELQVPAVASIRAPGAGKVVYVGSFRSYGRLLIIDHGGDYHTLVAGLSHLDVAEGAAVRTGDPIGSVAGVSGRAGRIYMEVRHMGVPLDPLPWLAARDYKVRG